MVSRWIRDFIVLLQSLSDTEAWKGKQVGLMYGRCPECREILSGENPAELVGDILGHVCLKHPEQALADS